MKLKKILGHSLDGLRTGLASVALLQFSIGAPMARAAQDEDGKPSSQIKHVIVINGENRSFDHVFATYQPQGHEKVWNLLSEDIITADGKPGANFSKAAQLAATDGH